MITLDSISSANSSIEIATAAGQALDIDGSGFLTISNTSFAVTATDLDIRSLLFASDSVDVSGSSVTVSSTDLDIRNLLFASDSVDVSGSTVAATQSGTWAVTIDNTSTWKTTAAAPSATVSELVGTPLASRNSVTIQNIGSQNVYVGPDNTVTASGATQGLLIPKGSSMEMSFDAGANLFAITASGTAALVIAEYAA